MEASQKILNFTDLLAWQEAHKVVVKVYKITSTFPVNEQFGLVSQMRRSSISITSNIAEAFGRWSKKEKDQFFSIASGSASELLNQLMAARDIHLITNSVYQEVSTMVVTAHKLLNGLRRSNQRPATND
jgi:four helix bundle protein